MAGFVDKIQDYKYLGTWQDALTGKKHAPLYVRFHDNAAILTRFQATYFNEAGAVYYKHWLSCQQAFGAGHEDCRKIRWFTQQVASSIHLAEWDDWWKDEHYDLQIGQHWNRLCSEEFEEASTLLKDVKGKREGLAAKFRELLAGKEEEDPMAKILKEIAGMEEVSTTPVTALLEAGKITQEDVEAAAASRIKELHALKDDKVWGDLKASLLPQVTKTCLALKSTAKVQAELKAAAEADKSKVQGVKARIPHMKLNYEKPGLYEYQTWFGKFIPRTAQFGFTEAEEE
eukprot:TRINITY_DN2233_c0_g1_i1.p1 TRINITY_DN2233_c0_g1~~TRINITY_DN2233_c0_g1_i1.p1  ORF type:complete len:299 (-),score=70.93 TRINITY_DN2233_c0_g1_i1:62-922(-)